MGESKSVVMFMRIIIFAVIVLSLSCQKAVIIGDRIDSNRLVDGIYEGYYKHGPNSTWVKVTIQHQKVAAIEIIKHDAWKGKRAEPIIPKRIIEQQSTNVDAVTGATNSSRVIMNAVQKAIEQAYQNKNE